MTDYAEEQAMELEALEAILADDLQGEASAAVTAFNTNCMCPSCLVAMHCACPAGLLPVKTVHDGHFRGDGSAKSDTRDAWPQTLTAPGRTAGAPTPRSAPLLSGQQRMRRCHPASYHVRCISTLPKQKCATCNSPSFASPSAPCVPFLQERVGIMTDTSSVVMFSTVLAELLWAHTPSYPDEPPMVKARRCSFQNRLSQGRSTWQCHMKRNSFAVRVTRTACVHSGPHGPETAVLLQ